MPYQWHQTFIGEPNKQQRDSEGVEHSVHFRIPIKNDSTTQMFDAAGIDQNNFVLIKVTNLRDKYRLKPSTGIQMPKASNIIDEPFSWQRDSEGVEHSAHFHIPTKNDFTTQMVDAAGIDQNNFVLIKVTNLRDKYRLKPSTGIQMPKASNIYR